MPPPPQAFNRNVPRGVKGQRMDETSFARILLATARPGISSTISEREFCRTVPPFRRGASTGFKKTPIVVADLFKEVNRYDVFCPRLFLARSGVDFSRVSDRICMEISLDLLFKSL